MEQSEWIDSFYRFQAAAYDQTRWAFLFGRTSILAETLKLIQPARMLEVGCGTGANIRRLSRQLPDVSITGVDLSDSMLRVARRKTDMADGRIRFVKHMYDRPLSNGTSFDVILFSYSLSMMNPGWATALDAAALDLASGGVISVVDFHNCRGKGLRKYMDLCHVRLEGHLLDGLKQRFVTRHVEVNPAYWGWWQYFTYVGTIAERDNV
jgi:S-adenosylmethionine-diacylgycerolhomoserine-N-methlytransferase